MHSRADGTVWQTASRSRPQVTSFGTIFPSLMYVLIMSPFLLLGRFRSARRRSPAERWTKP